MTRILLALALAVLLSPLLVTKPALACPPGCPSPIHPCCCPTPCPVRDQGFIGTAERILDYLDSATQAYGQTDVPSGGSTPVSEEEIVSSGILGLRDAIAEALADRESLHDRYFYTDLDGVHLPEIELAEDQLPHGSALTRNAAAQGVEPLNAARARLDSEFHSAEATDSSVVRRIRGRRADNLTQTALNAYARALLERQRLANIPPDHLTAMEREIDSSPTLSEDIEINSELKTLLAESMAGSADLTSQLLALRGAAEIASDSYLFYRSSPDNPAFEADPAAKKKQQSERAVLDDYADFAAAARKAIEEHNAAVEITRLEAQVPALMKVVEEHDARRLHVFQAETDLRSLLASLYAPGSLESAWARLKSDLETLDATGYADGNRYDSAAAAAKGVVDELFAQKASTRYGARRPNPSCQDSQRRREQESLCAPYVSPSVSASSLSLIDSYYSWADWQVDAYRVQDYPRLAQGRKQEEAAGDMEPGKAQAYKLLQYWREAAKRNDYWARMRRGDPALGYAMTPALWNELAVAAPACFYGPATVSQAALAARPDLFDVAPDCSHRVWSSGAAAGEEINHLNLGGVDQSLWLVENARLDYARDHAGKDGSKALVQAALDKATTYDIPASLAAIGRSDLVLEAEQLLTLLGAAKGDSSFEQHL